MEREGRDTAALSQNERFLERAYLQALLPGALSILSGCVNIIVDGILVGQKVGVDGLAAINLCVCLSIWYCA